MQNESVLGKTERQRLIASVVTRKRIGTQFELLRGSAPAIGRALDRLEHALIVGTLAGDDTCLVVARDSGDAAALSRELEQLLG